MGVGRVAESVGFKAFSEGGWCLKRDVLLRSGKRRVSYFSWAGVVM